MHTEKRPIVVVGSINMDLTVRVDRIPQPGETVAGSDFQAIPGGKGANQAVAVAKLGWPVHIIGCLGKDAYGLQLQAQMQAYGVDTSEVTITKGPSGIALITVSANGDNSIVVTPGANAHLTPDDLEQNITILRSAALVLTQLEIPLKTVEHLAIICEREHIPLILDPAPARALPGDLIHRITWCTPNETEANFYSSGITPSRSTSATAQHLHALGMRNVLLKLGANGSYVCAQSEAPQHVPSRYVQALDTTAAGDCFNAAFAVALASGLSAIDSARFATVAASISVTRPGAQQSMPSLEEVYQHTAIRLSSVS